MSANTALMFIFPKFKHLLEVAKTQFSKETLDIIKPAFPRSFPLSEMSIHYWQASKNMPTQPIRSIAMIGAVHDQCGNLWQDDVALLQNTLDYLGANFIYASADARIIPMNLKYDEDFLQVQPKADLLILCYFFDDARNEFLDRSKNGFRAQSVKTKNVPPDQHYQVWKEAISQTGARIIMSLGHEKEISVLKVMNKDFSLLLDPCYPEKKLPPIEGKPIGKRDTYGLAMRNDLIAPF